MKIFFLFVALFIFVLPTPSAAINLGIGEGSITEGAATQAGYAQATQTTFSETIGTVVRGALSLVGVVFMILMVYAGYLWMTAHGKEEQIEKAQNIIRSSIIGLIITVSAYSITRFVLPRVLDRTTGQSGTIGSGGSGSGQATCTVDFFDSNITDTSTQGEENEAGCNDFCEEQSAQRNDEPYTCRFEP